MPYVHEVDIEKSIMNYLIDNLEKSKGDYHKLRRTQIVSYIKKKHKIEDAKRINGALENLVATREIIKLFEEFTVYIPVEKKKLATGLDRFSSLTSFILICAYGYILVGGIIFAALTKPVTISSPIIALFVLFFYGFLIPLAVGLFIYQMAFVILDQLEKIKRLSINLQGFLVAAIIAIVAIISIFVLSRSLQFTIQNSLYNSISVGIGLFITLYVPLRFGTIPKTPKKKKNSPS